MITPCWMRGLVLVTSRWGVGFRVTPHWGEGGLHDYSPLGERMGCMITPHWGRGWVLYLLPAGEVGLMVTSRWESWFQRYSPLGERAGCMITPR